MQTNVSSVWIPAIQGLFIRGYFETDRRPNLLRVLDAKGGMLAGRDIIETRTDLGKPAPNCEYYNAAMAAFLAGAPEGDLRFEALEDVSVVASCQVSTLRTIGGFADITGQSATADSAKQLMAILHLIFEFFGKNSEWCRRAAQTRSVQIEVARSPTSLRNVIAHALAEDGTKLQIAKALLRDRPLDLRDPAGRYLAAVTAAALNLESADTPHEETDSSDQALYHTARRALDRPGVVDAFARDPGVLSDVLDKTTERLAGTPRGRQLAATLVRSDLLTTATDYSSRHGTDIDTALVATVMRSDSGRRHLDDGQIIAGALRHSPGLRRRIAALPEVAAQVLKDVAPAYRPPDIPRAPPAPSGSCRFSVVMAVHNGAAYLADAIESVRAQTLTDFEMIIVDDGSTDESGAIIAHYARTDPRIRVIRNALNRGQSHAFNVGIAASRADHVAFIDADDLWFPTKLERVAAFIDTGDRFCFVQHNMQLMFHDVPSTRNFRPTLPSGDYIAAMIEAGSPLPGPFTPTSGMTFPADILRRIGPIPNALRVCSDGFLSRAAAALGPVASLAAPLGYYRLHGENATIGNDDYDGSSYTSRVIMPMLSDYYARAGLDITLPGFKDPRQVLEDVVIPPTRFQELSDIDTAFARLWTYVTASVGSLDGYSPAFVRMIIGIQNAVTDGSYGELGKNILSGKFFNDREQALYLLLDCFIRLLSSDNRGAQMRLDKLPASLRATVTAQTLASRLTQRIGQKEENSRLLTRRLRGSALVPDDTETIADLFAKGDPAFGPSSFLQVQRALVAQEHDDERYFDARSWVQERIDAVCAYERRNIKTGALYRGFAAREHRLAADPDLQALPDTPDWTGAKLIDLAGPTVLTGEWLIRTVDGVCLSDFYIGTPHHCGSSYGAVTQARSDYMLLYPREPALHLDAAYLAGGDRNYYHWIIDVLPRLFVFRHATGARGLRLVTGPIDRPFQAAILAGVGIAPEEVTAVPYPATFAADRLVLPLMGPPNRKGATTYSAVQRFIHDVVGARLVAEYSTAPWMETGARLFVRRGHTHRRGLVNEDDIAEKLQDDGWRVIDPAQLSLTEQIAAFNTASLVCGSHGAGLASLAFSRPGTTVLELAFPRWSPRYFQAISAGRGLSHRVLYMSEVQSLTRLPQFHDGFVPAPLLALIRRQKAS